MTEEEMRGRLVLGLCNLPPRAMRGVTSTGMLLCASNEEHTRRAESFLKKFTMFSKTTTLFRVRKLALRKANRDIPAVRHDAIDDGSTSIATEIFLK